MAQKKKPQEIAHSKFSASGSQRWLNCPGSIALTEKAPEPVESIYAKEGTDAHHCLEVLLKAHIDGRIDKGRAFLEDDYPSDMIDHAEDAAREIVGMRIRGGITGDILCETRVDLSFVAPDMFGTVDVAIIREFGRLTVIDYKYGAGIPVEPDDNSQLLYYALGIAYEYAYAFDEVELVVIQPRAEHFLGTTRKWVTPIETLYKWRDTFTRGVAKAKKPDAKLKSGDWCKFCPATPICPKLSTDALELAQIEFSPADPDPNALVVPDPSIVPAHKLGDLITACDLLETWIKGVREHTFNEIKSGKEVPGYKLVEKRAHRKWSSEGQVAKAAAGLYGEENIFVKKLLSPAQMEKQFKNFKWVEEHCSKNSSGLTMVPESDKRDAYDPFSDFLD